VLDGDDDDFGNIIVNTVKTHVTVFAFELNIELISHGLGQAGIKIHTEVGSWIQVEQVRQEPDAVISITESDSFRIINVLGAASSIFYSTRSQRIELVRFTADDNVVRIAAGIDVQYVSPVAPLPGQISMKTYILHRGNAISMQEILFGQDIKDNEEPIFARIDSNTFFGSYRPENYPDVVHVDLRSLQTIIMIAIHEHWKSFAAKKISLE
jgi:hypothetical protein